MVGETGMIKFLNNQKNKFKVDYMFVFNMNIAEKFENFIQGQTKIIGSLKNNHFHLLPTSHHL